jgi:DNA-binding transcriptional MerR regulator
MTGATERSGGIRIGRVAKRLGVTTRTIRYYEELGLLGDGAVRSNGAHRLFSESDIEHLQHVLRLRDLLGLSLEALVDIARTVSMRAALRNEWAQGPSDEERLRILAETRPLVERQLALVQDRQRTLSAFATELHARLERMRELQSDLEISRDA